METDRELLRRYGQDGDEAAFAEVVRRHTDLVYSAALRLVAGDVHLARDVAQMVFCTLARKAGSLAHRANLLGWLHTTTRYSASVAVRSERRRRHHEQEACAMHDLLTPAPEPVDWAQLRPLLDEAVGCLRAMDREAVLLRFFQGKSHREVGLELGLNEALARKRVERALEKLRRLLARRGVTVSAALLAAAITAHSVRAAPAGLAAGLGSASLAATAKIGAFGLFWQSTLLFMKTKTIVITFLLLIGAAFVGAWLLFHFASHLPEKSAAVSPPNSANPTRVEPVRLAAAPVNSVGSSLSESPEPAVLAGPAKSPPASRAAQSGTGSVLVSAAARDSLNTVLLDVVRLVNAEDYATLVRNYLPKKGDLSGQDPAALELAVETRANDPATRQFFQKLAQMLGDSQNAPPIFSSDGRSARIKGPPDAQALVFVQMNGTWVFSGFESDPLSAPLAAAPAQSVKKTPSGTGGGYVPDP